MNKKHYNCFAIIFLLVLSNISGAYAAIIAAPPAQPPPVFPTPVPYPNISILDVAYTDGSIQTGMLSFGLDALPTTVNAAFTLAPGTTVREVGALIDTTTWTLADVLASSLIFGDATWSLNDLIEFNFQVRDGVFTGLSYRFAPVDSGNTQGSIILNFPLKVTGTDIATGEDVEYQYQNSSLSLSQVPEPAVFLLFSLGFVGLFAFHKRIIL